MHSPGTNRTPFLLGLTPFSSLWAITLHRDRLHISLRCGSYSGSRTRRSHRNLTLAGICRYSQLICTNRFWMQTTWVGMIQPTRYNRNERMKSTLYLYAAVIALAILIPSCTGPNGPRGEDGNAYVEITSSDGTLNSDGIFTSFPPTFYYDRYYLTDPGEYTFPSRQATPIPTAIFTPEIGMAPILSQSTMEALAARENYFGSMATRGATAPTNTINWTARMTMV